MVEARFGIKETLQFLEVKNAVHYAYDLGTPKGLGLESCDWDKEIYEAVVVDYNAAFLGLYIIDLGETRGFHRAHATFPFLGENAIRDDRKAVFTQTSGPSRGC